MLPLGVINPATVPQGSEIPEELMNNPVFGLKSENVIGEWRRVHNAELDDLYSSSNIRVLKSRRM